MGAMQQQQQQQAALGGAQRASGAAPIVPARPTSSALTSAPREMCRALYDYDATEPAELSFKAGDLLVVLQKDESGWWPCELRGRVGARALRCRVFLC